MAPKKVVTKAVGPVDEDGWTIIEGEDVGDYTTKHSKGSDGIKLSNDTHQCMNSSKKKEGDKKDK